MPLTSSSAQCTHSTPDSVTSSPQDARSCCGNLVCTTNQDEAGESAPSNERPFTKVRSLKLFFGNPDKWGPTAEGFLAEHGGDIWGIAEHHLAADA